jgi:hypothetical protein
MGEAAKPLAKAPAWLSAPPHWVILTPFLLPRRMTTANGDTGRMGFVVRVLDLAFR